MTCFIVEGGRALSGRIRPAGNKNAALPCVLRVRPQTVIPATIDVDFPGLTGGSVELRIPFDLALHGQAGPVKLAEIAQRQELSLAYLEQLFAKLRQAKLVKGVRGPGGGYRLIAWIFDAEGHLAP